MLTVADAKEDIEPVTEAGYVEVSMNNQTSAVQIGSRLALKVFLAVGPH